MAPRRLSSLVGSTKDGPFDSTIATETQLAQLGYEQELKRSFSLLGMVGFSFSIVTCWTALGGTLIVGIVAGGPPVMVWSWVGICLLSLTVAYSFAEMCSAYPTAGGQYSWVAILAPPKYARGAAFVTGWFMCTGIVAMGAVNNFVSLSVVSRQFVIPTKPWLTNCLLDVFQQLGANFILGMANLNNPSYTIERWHTVLVTYLIATLAALSNVYLSRWLNQISTFAVAWNILSFFVVIITILAANDHKQSASFVFSDFQNQTGFSSGGMAVMIGLLQTLFGMCCYDAPSHMIEEMLNPAKEAPQAIILSVYLGAVTGFVFLISAFFCIGDLDATATTPTGVPLIQIFFDSTGSTGGATTLASMITVIMLICSNSLMAEGSRALWAFSRDHGLPFSKLWARVNKRSQVPVYSVLLCGVLQAGLNSIYYASFEGFSTVISIATFGFYLSYAAPLFVRLWSLVTHANPAATTIRGGVYTLGRWSPYMNLAGLLFLVFAGIDFNFPQVGPVTASNMNYCSAAFGVIGLVSVVTWLFDGRKNFTGPQTPGIVNAIDAAGGGGGDDDKGLTPDRVVTGGVDVKDTKDEKHAMTGSPGGESNETVPVGDVGKIA
ncbi:GABA permease [Fonsecaea pedrosoi]|nr:GABA permease [Fonsecaea pedrosoi]